MKNIIRNQPQREPEVDFSKSIIQRTQEDLARWQSQFVIQLERDLERETRLKEDGVLGTSDGDAIEECLKRSGIETIVALFDKWLANAEANPPTAEGGWFEVGTVSPEDVKLGREALDALYEQTYYL
jgi:hypothetical protein